MICCYMKTLQLQLDAMAGSMQDNTDCVSATQHLVSWDGPERRGGQAAADMKCVLSGLWSLQWTAFTKPPQLLRNRLTCSGNHIFEKYVGGKACKG